MFQAPSWARAILFAFSISGELCSVLNNIAVGAINMVVLINFNVAFLLSLAICSHPPYEVLCPYWPKVLDNSKISIKWQQKKLFIAPLQASMKNWIHLGFKKIIDWINSLNYFLDKYIIGFYLWKCSDKPILRGLGQGASRSGILHYLDAHLWNTLSSELVFILNLSGLLVINELNILVICGTAFIENCVLWSAVKLKCVRIKEMFLADVTLIVEVESI